MSANTPSQGASASGAQVFATDALGRTLPAPAEVGPLRPDRYVGIFYFMFINFDAPVYDVSKILAAHPGAENSPASPPWGPFGSAHFWGEPLFGYYKITDPWVLRRHAQLLTDAGVDFVVFDTTNRLHYPEIMPVILDTWTELRAAGDAVPRCVFMVNTDAGDTARRIQETFYGNPRWADLWFRWDGKPLMICDPAEAPDRVKEAFTLRKAHWPFTLVNTHNAWHWEAAYPQVYSYDDDPSKPEEVNVSVGQNLSAAADAHVTMMNWGDARGRHFHDGALDPDPAAGLRGANFQEQWRRAFELDPEIVFVTGWNEWVAGRYEKLGSYTKPVGVFCDQYNQLNSRDAEMARGPLGDNFYCQLVANVRRFKGMTPMPALSGPKRIDLEGPFAQWDEVAPEFRDHALETVPRDFPGCGAHHYTNATGRNDIATMKIARDADTVAFLATTRTPLDLAGDPNRMQLLVDTDLDPGTGWEGFDLLVRRGPDGAATAAVWDGTAWSAPCPIRHAVGQTWIVYAVPRKLVATADRLALEFKWIDNLALPCDVLDFYVNGDVAPAGRFRYRYEEP